MGMNNFQTESRIEPLSKREKEILSLICEGLSNHEIAQKLFLSDNTIKWYNKQIYSKLGVNSRTQAISLARNSSLLVASTILADEEEIHPQHNLPIQLTSFFGREKEIVRIKELLSPINLPKNSNESHSRVRLLTLTGPGGVGKTRLAIKAGYGLVELYPNGIWLVELASLADPELVPHTIMTIFSLPEDSKRTPVMVLADYFRGKSALLILDNCEHLIDACTRLVDELLKQCPQLSVITTSREALGIEGEMVLSVPSLSLPPTDKSTLESINKSEAIRLFLDRATMAQPGFTVTEESIKSVAQVCRRLDGIALAIELAATRVRLLQVDQIAKRLDDAFQLLAGGSRITFPRQQTMRATIDWSYNLLSDPERLLFRRLAVFSGGARLEALEEICSDNGLEKKEVLDYLGQLVDKSLVMVDRVQDQDPRFYLLEIIHQYALEKLNESGETEAVHKRHARWYAGLAEIAEPHIFGHGQIEWMERLEQEQDNFRATLNWCLTHDIELGLRTGSGLAWFWQVRGHAGEGYQQLKQLLDTETPPTWIRAKALAWTSCLYYLTSTYEIQESFIATSLAMSRELGYVEGEALSNLFKSVFDLMTCDYDDGLRVCERCLALFTQAANKWGQVQAFIHLGDVHMAIENYDEAQVDFQKSLVLSRDIGDIDGISFSLFELGNMALIRGDFKQAKANYQESIPLARSIKNLLSLSWMHVNMSYSALKMGEFELGKVLLEKTSGLLRELGDWPNLAFVLNRLGRLACLQSEYDQAREYYLQSLVVISNNYKDKVAIWSITGLAELYALRGNPRKAARLLACAWNLPDSRVYIYHMLFSDMPHELKQIEETIRSNLDDPTFQAEQELGRQMSLADAIQYAQEGI